MPPTKALAKIGPHGVTQRARAAGWSDEEVRLIKAACSAQDMSDDEFNTFLYVSWERGLNPLKKEIYAIRRDGKITYQSSIDGFRVTAARTGLHAGTDDAIFTGAPGEAGFAASVTVYKLVGGLRCPFVATARWSEYYPGEKLGFMWRKMPHGQIAKCAESLGLRKGFPESLGGIYTTDEMAQAGADSSDADIIDTTAQAIAMQGALPSPEAHHDLCGCNKCMPAPDEAAPVEVITNKQRARLFAQAREWGIGEPQIREIVKDMVGIESTKQFPRSRYGELEARVAAAAVGKPEAEVKA